MTTTIANAAKRKMLIGKLSEGTTNLDILGSITFWTIMDVVITRDQFIAALTAVGLPEKYARERNYRSALIRAIRSMEEDKMVRAVDDNPTTIVFQFTAEIKNEDPNTPSLTYSPEVTVTVDKEAYGIFEDFAQSITKITDLHTMEESTRSAEIKSQLVEAFNREKNTYKSSDITRYIQKIFTDNADIVSLRQQGAIYFVPAAYFEVVQKVANLVNGLGLSCQFQYVPIPDVSSARKMVGDSFAEEVVGILAGMDDEVKKMKGSDKQISDKWVEHRLNIIRKVKDRIDMYCEVLGDKTADLLGKADLLVDVLKPRVLTLD